MAESRSVSCNRLGRFSAQAAELVGGDLAVLGIGGRRTWAVLLGVLVALTQEAQGQGFPPCYNRRVNEICTTTACNADAYLNPSCIEGPGYYGDPSPPSVPGQVGTDCNKGPGQFVSKCWYAPFGSITPNSGAPLNLNLLQGLGPADFPPRKNGLYDGSSPLVPNAFAQSIDSRVYAERPMDRDIIDLITGRPLLQEVDFELPFGGAIFRHVRTYSENIESVGVGIDGPAKWAEGTHWDWNGLFWMMSENPIFLIDLSFDSIAVNPATPGQPATKRCYFIPDSHHAIPFIYQTGTQNYVAPTWFDARLSHNGHLDGNGNWDPPATEFYVWLNRGAVKYTIKAHYEDHWNKWIESSPNPIPINTPPTLVDPWQVRGIPHYGIVTQIEDRNGNKVVIDHCQPRQLWEEDTSYHANYDDTQTDCCMECAQQCNAKGQINFVKLYPARNEGEPNDPEWTLIYTHRGFIPEPPNAVDPPRTLRHQNALHSIHAYRGNVDVPQGTCRTISGSTFCGKSSLAEVDAIDAAFLFSLPSAWQIEAKYLYSEYGTNEPTSHCQPSHLIGDAAVYDTSSAHRVGIRLLKSTVTRRSHRGSEQSNNTVEDKTYTIYRDSPRRSVHDKNKWPNAYSYLKAVYKHDTLVKLMRDNNWDSPNALFALPATETATQDLADVYVIDPSTGLSTTKDLWEVADIYMRDWRGDRQDNFPPTGMDFLSQETQGKRGYQLRQFLGGDLERIYFEPAGRCLLYDRRNGKGSLSTYYSFVTIPKNIQGSYNEAPNQCCFNTHEAFFSFGSKKLSYHYPFNMVVTGTCSGNQCNKRFRTDPAQVLFTTVIDEIKDGYDAGNYWIENASPIGLKSRRIVEMNPAGFILRDRKWTCHEGTCTLAEQDGAEETFVHDCKGRVVERRTKGWNSPLNGNTSGEGLIYVYKYEDDCPVLTATSTNCGCSSTYQIVNPDDTPRPAELMAEGIKKGTNGPVTYLRSFRREKPWRYDLVTKETRYRNLSSNLNPGIESPDFEIIQYDYDVDYTREGRPVTYKQVLRSGVPSQSGGAPMYLVERTKYNLQGNPAWLAIGSIATPTTTQPVAGDELFVTANLFDPVGHLLETVSDFYPGTATQPPGGGFHSGCYTHQNYRLPSAFDDGRFTRNSTAPQLNQHTLNFWHWGDSYPWHILLPNKKQIWRIKTLPPNTPYGTEEQWDFSDFVLLENTVQNNPGQTSPCVAWPSWDGQGGPFYQSGTGRNFGPVKISRSLNGKLEKVTTVALTAPLKLSPDPYAPMEPDFQTTLNDLKVELSVSIPKYDAQGRMVGMETQETGTTLPALTSYIAYDGWGNIDRQQDPDGTITRKTYDEKGRLEKVFKGTADGNTYWGGGTSGTDNLTLVEKRYYGEVRECHEVQQYWECDTIVGDGTNDIDQLVMVRNFRDKPANQYGGTNPSNENTLGWVMNYRYDWRQRPVWVQKKDSQGNNLNHTLTYYDNLDRVRLVADFGPTGYYGENYSAPEPPTDGTVTDADAAVLVATLLSNHPISLTETIYNRRGQVQETRNYNVANTSGAEYTATVNYYGTWNKPTEVHAPNSPIMRYQYDGKGRQIKASTMAAVGVVLREVSRTETDYNLEDKPTVVRRMEALHTATEATLNDSNSVSTWTHTWYDSAGRVIATANFGTNNAADTFATGQAPPPYITNPATGATTPPVNIGSDLTVTGCNASLLGTPIAPQVTCYAYDGKGRQWKVFHPDGTITETLYDSLGRTIETIQNAGSADPNLVQRTQYVYNNGTAASGGNPAVNGTGQLNQIKAILPGHSSDSPHQQVTEMVYGADVVDSSFGTISQNNAFIKEVRFPDRVTGAPSAGGDHFLFKYYPDGSVAERIDQRGIVMRFKYDELGRLAETLVDDTAWYPHTAPAVNFTPPARITRITYSYTSDGLPEEIFTYQWKDLQEMLLCANRFEYDERRNLIREYQSRDGSFAAETPSVDYTWAYSPFITGYSGNPPVPDFGSNYNRLTNILYPPDVATGSRLNLVLQYGANDATVDSALSRITRISHTSWRPNDANQTYDATFAYAGTSRRVGSTRGNGVITQSTFDGGAYSGLDRFGRMRDLHYKDGSGATLQRFQYGYDLAGNRLYARTTQFPAVEHDNDRSWRYEYDSLHRLVGASMGTLNATNTAMAPGGSGVPVPRTTTWALDNLGNWSADDELYHSVQTTGDFDGDGQLDADSRFRHHNVNSANEISQIVASGIGITPDTFGLIYDPAGNLVFDGKYVYMYDAWNRLLSVNFAGSMAIPSGGPDSGRVTDASQLGAVVCWFSYDGLGRLICKSTPVNEGVTGMQSKSMYYDGVRRIAEVIARPPIIQQGEGLIEGGEENNENPMALEGEDPPQQQIIQPPPDPIPVPGVDFWTDRQYVYGPEYVDEFLWQVPTSDMPAAYMLQDGNYNVMALVDAAGAVLTQQTFEPYGTIATFEKFDNHAVNRVGHQGLFFERFDGTYADPTLSTEADGFYYNRNRFYDPVNGRFTSRDPNETGIPILTALCRNGQSTSILLRSSSPISTYSDGANLYQYVGSNPVCSIDPSGLFSLPDISASAAIEDGLFAMEVTSKGKQAFNYFKMFVGGVSAQNVLAVIVMDTAMDFVGGKAFDVAFKSFMKGAAAFGSKAKIAKGFLHRHHVLPKFLGGNADGILVGLSADVHKRFHSDLWAALKAKGLSRPGKGSTDEWGEYLSQGNRQSVAMQALIETSQKFDQELGGNKLVSAVMKQLEAQGISVP